MNINILENCGNKDNLYENINIMYLIHFSCKYSKLLKMGLDKFYE